MDYQSIERMVRNEFSELFENDKKIEQVFKRIRIGTATFEDAGIFANQIGEILVKSFNMLNLEEIPVDYLAYGILENALIQNYRLSALVSETIQNTLNEMEGIGVAAIVPKVNSSRIEGLQKLIMEAEDPTQIIKIMGEPVVNFTQSCVDSFVEDNAKFQKRIGKNPKMIRKYEGEHYDPHRKPHMQDCAFCKRLAGEWDYGEEPSAFYKRHEGCRCTVAYFPSKKSQGQIMALRKGEKDTDKVLWQTGRVTSNSRKAVLARRRREFGKEEARKILNEEWKGGFNGNAERHF